MIKQKLRIRSKLYIDARILKVSVSYLSTPVNIVLLFFFLLLFKISNIFYIQGEVK